MAERPSDGSRSRTFLIGDLGTGMPGMPMECGSEWRQPENGAAPLNREIEPFPLRRFYEPYLRETPRAPWLLDK